MNPPTFTSFPTFAGVGVGNNSESPPTLDRLGSCSTTHPKRSHRKVTRDTHESRRSRKRKGEHDQHDRHDEARSSKNLDSSLRPVTSRTHDDEGDISHSKRQGILPTDISMSDWGDTEGSRQASSAHEPFSHFKDVTGDKEVHRYGMMASTSCPLYRRDESTFSLMALCSC
jgi:hypothetical protein